MPIRAAIAALALAGACALVLAAPGTASQRPAETKCDRGVDLGFTTAKVYARHMTCVRARQIVRRWRRKVNRISDGPAPRKTMVAGYTCRFGGSELLLTLSCTKGRKRAKSTWGG